MLHRIPPFPSSFTVIVPFLCCFYSIEKKNVFRRKAKHVNVCVHKR
ncbi:hypothetical protein B4110_1736 [Parageobacillus toebii]|uniref:Uncharacterized protein n=1 Tax=Parageobacillus toebii TaxID=153151 RepID=A0A150MNX9_9BACL|nr:hypothetical protein B4110_1736 [Parageobacillus toebii]